MKHFAWLWSIVYFIPVANSKRNCFLGTSNSLTNVVVIWLCAAICCPVVCSCKIMVEDKVLVRSLHDKNLTNLFQPLEILTFIVCLHSHQILWLGSQQSNMICKINYCWQSQTLYLELCGFNLFADNMLQYWFICRMHFCCWRMLSLFCWKLCSTIGVFSSMERVSPVGLWFNRVLAWQTSLLQGQILHFLFLMVISAKVGVENDGMILKNRSSCMTYGTLNNICYFAILCLIGVVGPRSIPFSASYVDNKWSCPHFCCKLACQLPLLCISSIFLSSMIIRQTLHSKTTCTCTCTLCKNIFSLCLIKSISTLSFIKCLQQTHPTSSGCTKQYCWKQ